MPSGTLYLAFHPYHKIRRRDPTFKRAQLWRIDVTERSKILYAGTLVIDAEVGVLLFGKRYLKKFLHMEVRDEREEAQALVDRHVQDLGPIKTVLMQRHVGPIILTTPIK